MHARRKILLVAIAVVLPATSFAVFGGPTLFAGAAAPAFPVACQMSATVTFNPPLTKAGTDTTNKAAVTTTTIAGGSLTNCLSAAAAGAPTSGAIPTTVISTAAVKGAKVGKVQHYTIGSCPAFASTNTLKSLKNLALHVNWTGGMGGSSTFTVKSPSAAINNFGEVGFVFGGKAVLGSYSEKSLNQITAYLDATASSALAGGCNLNQTVSGATVDSVHSVAIL